MSTATRRSKPAEPATATLAVFAAGGSGQAFSQLAALPVAQQRAAFLLLEALQRAATEADLSESAAFNMVYRVLQGARLQEQKAPAARHDLAKVLGPSLDEIDPVPYASVEQARRGQSLRASLLRDGAYTTAAIAEGRGITANNARQWVSRHRKAHRIFTVTHEGETLVPAFLLNEQLDPRPEAQAAIHPLRLRGEDGWALWAWFGTPSAWVGGRIPADLLASDPDLVAESARQRAAAVE